VLERLRSIVQKVNAARDLQSALDIIVQKVRLALDTQVCSVFLLDKDINAHVLMASDGLKKESVGHVSLEAEKVSLASSRNMLNRSICRMPRCIRVFTI